MKEITSDSFTSIYYQLVDQVFNNYEYECAPRDMKIKEILGVSFVLTNPRNRLPYIPSRNFSISYYVGELLWYLDGRDDVEWIAKYSPFWLNVTDDNETVRASYGSRLLTNHDSIAQGREIQWNRIVSELKRDPDSRRAVVYFGQPADHIDYKLDVGCTTSTQFFLRDNKLHQIVNMRSSDLILGIPYDVAAFTIFQEKLANELGVELGNYIHRSNSLHIYERNFPLAEAIVKELNSADAKKFYPVCPPMPKNENIGELITLEANLWKKATSPEEVNDFIDWFNSKVENEYWRDWALILASHRAKKLTNDIKVNKEFRKQLLQRTSFSGYKFFRK